jgi:hypothetical protein
VCRERLEAGTGALDVNLEAGLPASPRFRELASRFAASEFFLREEGFYSAANLVGPLADALYDIAALGSPSSVDEANILEDQIRESLNCLSGSRPVL